MTKTLLVVLLFAWPAMAQDQAAEARASAGCGPSDVTYQVKADKAQHPVGQVEPGKALVYVFNQETRNANVSYLGSTTIRVGVDGAWAGANTHRTYFFISVSPGAHRMCASWQGIIGKRYHAAAAAVFTAEAGNVYYFQTIVEARSEREPAVKLEPLDAAQGQLLIANSALSTSRAKK